MITQAGVQAMLCCNFIVKYEIGLQSLKCPQLVKYMCAIQRDEVIFYARQRLSALLMSSNLSQNIFILSM